MIFTLKVDLTGGSKRTADFARRHGKPWIHIPSVDYEPGGMLLEFVRENGIEALNVAGSRESKEPGVYEFVKRALEEAFFSVPEPGTWLGGSGEG